MKRNEKMWALLVSLGKWGGEANAELQFDEEMWEYIIDEAEKTGINTIILDTCGAIAFSSHPELNKKGVWSRKKLRNEIKRCKERNIKLLPELNFATPHDGWLGEYHKMVSTNTYYKVCRDLINEVYETFEHPEYIHIGMDEEDAKHVKKQEIATYRQGDLYWHDLRYLIDCVIDTGAKPWIWSCPLFDHPEEYEKHIDADEAIISPWYYNAFRKEHWTPVESRQVYITYYNEDEYKNLGIKYVEEDPFLVNVRKLAVPLLEKGYKYVPCASVCNECDYNTSDLVEYFKENTPEEQLIGFVTAPWKGVLLENKKAYADSFRFLKEAKEKYFK